MMMGSNPIRSAKKFSMQEITIKFETKKDKNQFLNFLDERQFRESFEAYAEQFYDEDLKLEDIDIDVKEIIVKNGRTKIIFIEEE